jgi:hypothetical protein
LILGNQGHGNNELFVKLNKLNNDIDQIMNLLSIPSVKMHDMTDENIKNIKSIKSVNGDVLSDILKTLHQSKEVITNIKAHEGVEDNAKLKLPSNKIASITDVYNMAWHIEADLAELKVMFGIENSPVRVGIKEDKTLLDSYHKVSLLKHKLLMLSDKVLVNHIRTNNILANKKKATL